MAIQRNSRPQARVSLLLYAVLACGAIVIAMLAAQNAAAAPPNLAGLDRTFGHAGVATSRPHNHASEPNEIMSNPSGTIVTQSIFEHGYRANYTPGVVFTEFDAAGRVVKRFGKSGVAIYNVRTRLESVQSTLDDYGRILMLLDTQPHKDLGYADLTLVRLRSNGVLDKTFNHGTPLLLHKYSDLRYPSFTNASLKIDSDGSIYVFNGPGSIALEVFKVSNSGSLDPTYGTLGRAIISPKSVPTPAEWLDIADVSHGSVYLTGGKIETATFDVPGGSPEHVVSPWIIKLGPEGQRDESFGVNGEISSATNGPIGSVGGLRVLPDGNLISRNVFSKSEGSTDDNWITTSRIDRLDASGIPTDLDGPSSQPFPVAIWAPGDELLVDSFFFPSGALSKLTNNTTQHTFSLTTMSADGVLGAQNQTVKVPRALGDFYASAIDHADGSMLISGSDGKRVRVLRILPKVG